MTFGLDVCSYLSYYHTEWDKNVVDNGFDVTSNEGELSPVISTFSDHLDVKGKSGYRLNVSKLNVLSCIDQEDVKGVLYLNMVPKTKVDCICVYDTGGAGAIRYHGLCKPIEQPTCQIRVRHHSRKVCEETAYKIYILMDEIYHEVINDRHYECINAVSSPSYLASDMITTSGKAYEFVLNLNSKVRRN